jgi:hypothetical protein
MFPALRRLRTPAPTERHSDLDPSEARCEKRIVLSGHSLRGIEQSKEQVGIPRARSYPASIEKAPRKTGGKADSMPCLNAGAMYCSGIGVS